MSTIGLTASCPQCAAPVRFGGAHSVVCICRHCNSAVVRAESSVESLGKMPDLVAIDTRLALGDSGRMQQLRFEVLGRLQLHQGTASWNEWYVSWSDGSFGWLAEARGRVIVSHRVERAIAVPFFESLQPGQRLELEGLGSAVIEEVGKATLLSAEGELPFQPSLRSVYRFADASIPGGLYATLDYAAEDQGADIFVGRELSYEQLELRSHGPAREDREPESRGAFALRCPGCSSPVSLRLSSSVAVVCPSCHKLWSHEDGKLALVTALKQRVAPALPLGARGQLFQHKWEVIGFTRRAVTVAGVEYSWDEYLLHGPSGYSWLSENQGHWTHLTPIPAAAVTVLDVAAVYLNDRYKHFQSSQYVRYVDIQGEFYWEVRPSKKFHMRDYVRDSHLLSVEESGDEHAWTHGVYVPAAEVWKSFGQTTQPPAQSGVAPCQPNPHRAKLREASTGLLLGAALFVLFTVALQIALPKKVRLSMAVPMNDEQAVTLSDAFVLSGGVHAASVRAHSEFVNDGWVGLELALIHVASGQSTELDMDLSYFHGWDDGESWSDDNRSQETRLGSIQSGSYILRVAPHFEAPYPRPDTTRVDVVQGVFLWLPFWLCLLGLGVWPSILWIRSGLFESRRWSESDYQTSSSSDD